MKRSKLCFGLLLALVIMLGLSSNVCSDVSALAHDYNGINFLSPQFPLHFHTDSDGKRSINWDYTYSGSFDDFISPSGQEQTFSMFFTDPVSSSDRPTSYSNSLTYFDMYYQSDDNSCQLINSSFLPILRPDSSYNQFISQPFYFDDRINNFATSSGSSLYPQCYRRASFSEGKQAGEPSTVNLSGYLTCGLDNGASCSGIYDTRSFARNELLPNWYTTDGFYIHDTAIDTDSGIHYNHSFSFSDLFGSTVHSFSSLTLPLFTYDNYWFDSSNFYAGRHLEWRGVFEFDGSFSWNPNISNNGSFWRIDIYGNPTVDSGSSKSFSKTSFPCTVNLRTVSELSVKQLEYSCSGDLPWDSPFLYPVLYIDGGSTDGLSDYVFLTDSEWRFGQQLLITDYDETPGSSLGGDIRGNKIPGSASVSGSSEDWFSSLSGLFSFDFINPFAPIFDLFNNDSCAQIPVLASMLHSEETEICPWFDSTVRNITTPVIGLASMMLIFGFVIRWLGSRSGNFIEDSGGVDINENYHLGNKYRRKK